MTNLKWKSVSGHIVGLGHVEHDEPCQDRSLSFENEHLTGIVVCDGAGSCKHSELGAIAVSEAIANVDVTQFDEWFEATDASLRIEAFLLDVLKKEQQKIDGAQLIDFSCTLLAVLVKGEDYLAIHVGDGVICQTTNNEVSVLSHPENGFYANETFFVTMAPLGDHFRTYKGKVQPQQGFIAMSDGAAISFYVYAQKEMQAKNTAVLFDYLMESEVAEAEEEFPNFLEMIRKNTNDDCAVAVLVEASSNSNDMPVATAEDDLEDEEILNSDLYLTGDDSEDEEDGIDEALIDTSSENDTSSTTAEDLEYEPNIEMIDEDEEVVDNALVEHLGEEQRTPRGPRKPSKRIQKKRQKRTKARTTQVTQTAYVDCALVRKHSTKRKKKTPHERYLQSKKRCKKKNEPKAKRHTRAARKKARMYQQRLTVILK